jgi:hypothetical protein
VTGPSGGGTGPEPATRPGRADDPFNCQGVVRVNTDVHPVSARGGSGSLSHAPSGREAGLVPVLARVVELGRGPPALVRWVRDRLGRAGGVGAGRGPAVRQLARELARLLARDGAVGTLPHHAGRTLRLPAGREPQSGERT